MSFIELVECAALIQSADEAVVHHVGEANVETSAAANRGHLDAAGARFVDYWVGTGAWAGMADARRRTVAAAMGQIAGEWHAVFEDPEPLEAFAALDVPTLCLVGSNSPASSRAVSRLLAKTLPRASEVEIDGVGHMGRSPTPTRSTH